MAELSIPEPFTTRAYRPEDAAAVAELFNAAEEATGGHPGYSADDTQAIVDGAVADPATDVALMVDGDDLVAAGMVLTPPEGGFRADLYGAVRPDRLGRGIGRALLGWQLARVTEIHAAVAPGRADWVAETYCNADDGPSQRLFARFGLSPVRYFFEMAAPAKPDAAAGVTLPAGLRAVPYAPEHERTLYEAHVEAFSDHWGFQQREFEHWIRFTTRSELFRPDLSRLAFDDTDGELAGYLLAYDDADDDRTYIGQVGTRRQWRRRGLAGALLAQTLAASAEAGKARAYLGVDAASPTGAVGVYERVGFAVETRAASYHRAV
jgi:mycothiol synthase